MELQFDAVLASFSALRLHIPAVLGVLEAEPMVVAILRDELHARSVNTTVLDQRELQVETIFDGLPALSGHVAAVLGVLQVEAHAERDARLDHIATGPIVRASTQLCQRGESCTTAEERAGAQLSHDQADGLLSQTSTSSGSGTHSWVATAMSSSQA
eukprot:CAMPEP_0115760676 /NCGR_PEP_ID=MMETSP0272-20121206/100121_1 /TAXON_ID=71861 /ORGANISM="Scrippsiella trochoidea, Strain CCMP3099" /LENGTH=156 /DNA_ID=CAMNT_0003206347 /DNA_START=230 /DNA_END=700 /DNA_ORIENTATION=-